jgi:hypothetical protein
VCDFDILYHGVDGSWDEPFPSTCWFAAQAFNEGAKIRPGPAFLQRPPSSLFQ